ncbi:pirin family protein [Paraburkholderia sp. GAS32]|uniref:pirin family protein n=1 Tax=Paraburkholderia sp. GAS32 TaxID=3035129 RepID=UPI003D2473CC
MNISCQDTPVRAIEHRTRGHKHGSITRLMNPSDLGNILKPFVFLDLFDHDGPPFEGGLHPHSGIATLTYIFEGVLDYTDPDDVRGKLPAGGVEWMQAGRGMWHGGGIGAAGRTRGFQLWVALPPDSELGPTISRYLAPDEVKSEGPVRVLLGSYGNASSAIRSPSSINYLAVRLKAGERWRYEPPVDHAVLWTAIASGSVLVPDRLDYGVLATFAPSSQPVEFEAASDTEFVVGSAAPHDHSLVLGYYSVHSTPAALREGEAHISRLRNQLVKEGRL